MRRGAFTVLEMIVVVAIVAAIGAIALPSLASRVVAAQAGHAVRAIESAVALASAEAMQRGSVVVLVAEREGDTWVLYAHEDWVEEPVSPGLDAQGGLPPARPPGPAKMELSSFGELDLSASLPRAGEAEAISGFDTDPSTAPDGANADREGGRSIGSIEGSARSVSLGRFFPDGTCRPTSPLYMISRDGARRAIHLRPLTSRVDVRALPSVQEEAAQSSEGSPGDELPPVLGGEEDR